MQKTKEHWGLWGDYPSLEFARQQIADQSKSTYDNDDVVDISLEWFSRVSLFDYPILYWLLRFINEKNIDSIMDFGGHIGVKYYAYQGYIRLPDSFKWRVVDVPAMVHRGKEKAKEEGIKNLEFFSDVEEVPATSVLFSSGSLMYADISIDQVVSNMLVRPSYILINKLAVLPDTEVISLEGFGHSCIPYRVFSLRRFNEAVSNLDYELIDSWEIEDRTHSIPFVERAHEVKSIGQVWKSLK